MPARDVPVTAITDAQRIAETLDGPAFVAPGPEADELIAGLADGRVAVFEAGDEEDDRHELEVVGVLGARPFGVARGFGEVVIAAAGDQGLIATNEGRVIPLASQAQGRPIGYAADLAISFARSLVYFTDASDRHGPNDSWAEFVEHGARGRLLAYDERNNSAEVLADGLHFPFGVALARDESFILVSEMTEYRVLRRWLSGPRVGEIETFVDGLPGYPADVSATERGTFWIALYAPRIGSLDRLADSPWLRSLWFKLPRLLQPKPERVTSVIEVDADGKVLRELRDDAINAYAPVTGVLEREGALYLGSPTQKGVLKIGL